MALKTIPEKTGDVKERAKRPETLSRGDVHWRGLGRRRVGLLARARCCVVPVRMDRPGPRGAVRPSRTVRAYAGDVLILIASLTRNPCGLKHRRGVARGERFRICSMVTEGFAESKTYIMLGNSASGLEIGLPAGSIIA